MSTELLPSELLVRVILDDLLTEEQKKLLDLKFGKVTMTAEQRFMNRYKNLKVFNNNLSYATEKAAIVIEKNLHLLESIKETPRVELGDQFIWKFDFLFAYGE